MSGRDFDMVVIGSGSAGLTAAKHAARWGARVALVDKNLLYGGDCTWYGCVPSKALIRCATAVHEAKTAERFGVTGVDAGKVGCDWEKVKKHVRDCQQTIYDHDDSPKVIQAHGVETIVNRKASFKDQFTLKLEKVDVSPEGAAAEKENSFNKEEITADTFVIATGAGPFLPPIKGLQEVPYHTYESIFNLEEFPKALMVVGGGPIGAELAQAFKRLGSDVTNIDLKLMEREDDDVREVMEGVWEKEGIKFVSGFAMKVWKGDKGLHLEVSNPNTKVVTEVTGTHLLVASGRKPKGLEHLMLEKAKVNWEKGGPKMGIVVDSKHRTSSSHIFACGDCVSAGMQFTHLAGIQGAGATLNALIPFSVMSAPAAASVPRATFTHPEVATVGLTESQAVEKFGQNKIHILKSKLGAIDRAVCEGETTGFVKLVYHDSRTILGATVVAPVAGELASELGLAVHKGMKVKEIGLCMHAYPTWAFGLMVMCSEVYMKDMETSGFFKCFRSCCARRLKGNLAALASVEMNDLRPH